jgi:hypothetical protein
MGEIKNLVPVDKIIPNPDNPRMIFSLEEFNQLVDSIKNDGIITPLTVYEDKENDRFIIINGERRWRAAKKLNLEKVPCYIRPPPKDRLIYILEMFKSHTIQEKWLLYPTAKKLGEVIGLINLRGGKPTNKYLSTITGLTPHTVKRCKLLLSLSKKFQNQLFEEEKLLEFGVQPRNALTEDFFIELLNFLQSIKSNDILFKSIYKRYPNEDYIIEKFIKKFKANKIMNITDFRYLNRTIRLERQQKIPTKEAIKIISDVIEDENLEITSVYETHIRAYYDAQNLERLISGISIALENMEKLETYPLSEETMNSLNSLIDSIRKFIQNAKRGLRND